MKTNPKLVILALVVSLIFAVAPVGAQDKPVYPVGTINFEATAVAAGIGFSWGAGWLAFEGKNYPVKVDGLSVGAVGISKVNAIGNVYNMKQASDIAGTYVAGGAGLAIVGGVKGTMARNDKGVVIDMVASQKGVSLNFGPEGFTVKMK